MSEQRQNYSEEQFRTAVNDKAPHDALVMVLVIMQRIAISLERIADASEEPPAVLFEEAPRSDGLGDAFTSKVTEPCPKCGGTATCECDNTQH